MYKKLFEKSFLAGICIGLAAYIYLTVGGVIGAILFSVGLVGVLQFGLDLFTGKYGFYNLKTKKWYDWILYPLYILWGNVLGVVLVTICMPSVDPDIVNAIIQTRMTDNIGTLFAKGVGCGFLMTLAVYVYKQSKSYIGVLLCIPAFILSGMNHCIADIFYWYSDGLLNWRWFITVVGNWFGCILPMIYIEHKQR